MNAIDKHNAKPSIVRVLTLSFAAFVALNLAAFAATFYNQNSIRFDQETLLSTDLPNQTALAVYVNTTHELSQHLQSLQLAQDIGTFQDIETRIIGALYSPTQTLAELPTASRTELKRLSVNVDLSIRNQLDMKREELQSLMSLDKTGSRIAKQLDTLELTLLTLSIENDLGKAWEQIELDIRNWQRGLAGLKTIPDRATIDAFRLSMRSEIRELARILSTADESPQKRAASALLGTLLNTTYEKDGLFGDVARVRQARAQLADVTVITLANIRTMSQFSEDLLGELTQRTPRQVESLNKRTVRSLWYVAALGLTAILLNTLLVRRYVKNGIADNLQQLANRTLVLSNGGTIEKIETNYKEFEEIEGALAVFSSNAENLRQTELQLLVKNDHLQRAIDDLERFTYAASHDLRSPLRAAKTIASFLEEDLSDIADEASMGYLEQLRTRVEGMEHLLDDLLEYAHASYVSDAPTTVCLQELVEQQLHLLEGSELVELKTTFFPTEIDTSSTALAQVFRNLIDNAIKHHPAFENPESNLNTQTIHIEVVGQPLVVKDQNGYEFTVADSGNGIPPGYEEKVKQLFETIAPKSKRPSSGLGLSLVTKILDQYHGQLVLKNRKEGGLLATFTWFPSMAATNPPDPLNTHGTGTTESDSEMSLPLERENGPDKAITGESNRPLIKPPLNGTEHHH